MNKAQTVGAMNPMFPSPKESLGQFVRERRKSNRMTQEELAELAGVGVRLVGELERGKPTLRMDRVNRVLGVFGVQLGVAELRS